MGVTENMLSNTTTEECVRHSELPSQSIYNRINEDTCSASTSLECHPTGSEMFEIRFCNRESSVRNGCEYVR
jgi:hypothetical protein